jgi:opacity protein-like surface antigen
MRARVYALAPRRIVPEVSPENTGQRNRSKEGEVLMFVRTLGLSLTILVFSFGAALAEDDEESYGRDGIYLMLSGAFVLDESKSGSKFDLHTEGKNSGAIEAVLGYRWNAYLALEFQGEVSIRTNELTREGDDEAEESRYYWSAFGPRFKYFILTGRIQPFVSTGIGILNHHYEGKGREWGGLWRAGAGLDYYVTDGLVVDFTLEYLHGTGRWTGLRDVRFALGPKYRF